MIVITHFQLMSAVPGSFPFLAESKDKDKAIFNTTASSMNGFNHGNGNGNNTGSTGSTDANELTIIGTFKTLMNQAAGTVGNVNLAAFEFVRHMTETEKEREREPYWREKERQRRNARERKTQTERPSDTKTQRHRDIDYIMTDESRKEWNE